MQEVELPGEWNLGMPAPPGRIEGVGPAVIEGCGYGISHQR